MSANTFFIVNDLTLNYFMLKTQKYIIYLNAQNKSNIFKRFQMFKSCNLKKFGKVRILVKYEYNNFKIAKALNCLNKMEAKSKSTWENIAFGCFNNLFHLFRNGLKNLLQFCYSSRVSKNLDLKCDLDWSNIFFKSPILVA